MAELLTVTCPSCGTTSSKVPPQLAGRTVRCSHCATRFAVPAAVDAQPTVPEPSQAPTAPTVAEADLPRPTAAAAETTPKTASGAPSWQPGEVLLGLYEVIGVLGHGGMGRVYRVRHRGWGLDLALKVPLPAMLEAAGGADLFEKEAETWVNLGLHPHVVTCHYVRRLNGVPLVFAELVDGGSLHEAIRAGRLESAEAILDVAIQFAWGLDYAHRQGLVHRDVKPANVMLTAAGLAKVTDFGLARARSVRLGATSRAAAAGATMTVDGGGGATPAYLSPEQARGDPMSRRSDAWSFALSVFEIFLGRRTWNLGLEAPEVLAAYRRDGSLASGRPAMPEAVAELLGRCLRANAEERPHDLAEIAGVLRAAYEQTTGRAYARLPPEGGRGSADALNNRAASLVDLGRFAEAATAWKRALETEPHHVEATFNGGVAAWTGGRVTDTELLRRMEEACRSHGRSGRAQHLLGRLHLLLGQNAEALAAFRRAADFGATDEVEAERTAAQAPPPSPSRTLQGAAATITALATTGESLIAASGGELRVWDAASGRPSRSIAVPDGPVRSMVAMPDGRCVLVGAEKAPLTVWDLASGRAVRSFARTAGFAASLSTVPGGRRLVSGGSDRTVRLWDADSGRCLRELTGHEDAVTAVASGGDLLASASRDGTIRIWSLADGRCLAVLRGHKGRVLAVAVSEAESRVVSAGEDGVVNDWGLHSHALVRAYVSHAQPVNALLLAADGSRVVSGSSDCTVRVFDAGSERLSSVARFDGAVQAMAWGENGTLWVAHGAHVSAAAEAPLAIPAAALCRPSSATDEEARATSFETQIAQARRSIAAGDLATAFHLARAARSIPGRDRAGAALAVWDDLTARLPRRALLSAWEEARFEGHREAVLAVAVEPARAATASVDGSVCLWDLAARRLEHTLRGHDGAVTGVAFAAGGASVLSCGRDGTLRQWDATNGSALGVIEAHRETVAGLDLSPDGSRAASAGWDGTVRVWDLGGRTVVHVLEAHGANVAAVRFSADGQVLASAGWDGTTRLWDAASGAALATLSGHEGNVTALAWHPAGRQLATGGEDRTVRIVDPRSKRETRVLAGHEGEVTGLEFTPDGRFLLSSSRDRTVRAWDLRRGEAVRTLAHPDMVLGLRLAGAGNLLLTAGADRTARLWHLDWDPEPAAAAAATRSTVSIAGGTVHTSAVSAPTVRSSTLRDEIRRSSILPPQMPRAAARAARSVPWRWLTFAGIVAACAIVSFSFWHRSPPRLRLSSIAKAVAGELDLIDLAAFGGSCPAGEYEQHLDAVRGGNPSARDVACVAGRASAGVVADVLDGAPLTGPDQLATRRLRRNAASALGGLRPDALPSLCLRLADPRDEVRQTAALALGPIAEGSVNDCLSDVVASGTGPSKAAAASALRQRLARGLMPPERGWPLVQALLRDPDPEARKAGLQLLPLFGYTFAKAAASALLEDADPDVAAAAQSSLSSIEGVHRGEQLAGSSER